LLDASSAAVAKPDLLTTALQYLVLLYSGTRLARLIGKGEPRWFDLMFWAFTYVWLGLAGLAQYLAGVNPYRLHFQQSQMQAASILALVGMLSFDSGHRLAFSMDKRREQRFSASISTVAVRRLAVAALLITPVVVYLLGGAHSLWVTRSERTKLLYDRGLLTAVSKVRGGILLATSYALPLVATLGLLHLMNARRDLGRRPAWIVGALLLVCLVCTVGNPVSASRYWAGTIVLSIVFSLKRSNRPKGFRLVSIGVLLALVCLFPYADWFRYGNVVESRGQSLASLLVRKMDYDSSVQLVTALAYVHEHGYTYGRQLLGAVAFFVPREIWPTKPIATGSILADYVHLGQNNVSSPLWVETYIDGGYLLVATGFVTLGFFSVWLQAKSPALSDAAPWRPVLLAAIAAYLPIMLRGSLSSSISGLTLIVGLTCLLARRDHWRDPKTSHRWESAGRPTPRPRVKVLVTK
jgi:hypothetical protein